MAASDARPIPRRNVAYRLTVPILDNDGDLVTGAAGLDSEVSKDGGAFADCTNEATEIGSSGIYTLDLTATEMDADTVVVIVKTSTTDAKTTPVIMYPEEAGDVRVDVVQISGDATAADNLEAYTDGTTPIPSNVTQISGDATSADNLEAYTDGTTPMPVNATQISGDGTAADNAEAFFDGTGYAGTNNVIPTVTTLTNKTGFSLSAAGVQAIWDALTSALTTTGSIGKYLVDQLGEVLLRLPVALVSGRMSSYTGAVDAAAVTSIQSGLATSANQTTILARIGAFAGSGANTILGLIQALARKNVSAPSDMGGTFDPAADSLEAHTDTGIPTTTTVPTVTQIRQEMDSNSADLDSIIASLATIAGYLDTEIAAIKAKTDNLPASPAAVGSAMTLTSGERDAVAAALLDLAAGIETGLTVRQGLRVAVAALAGKLSGAATSTVTIRNIGDSLNRISATVDADGNRSAVTLNTG